jgi:hypothetical protein
MTASGSKSLPTLGFLTVVEHPDLGWTGGYLVLNLLGRPLEFHCTAPVKPNRAQEILYGPTLKAYLCGEQIGQTLLEKSQHHPLFVCTDVEAVLAVRETTFLPVALLAPENHEYPSGTSGTRLPAEIAGMGGRDGTRGSGGADVKSGGSGDAPALVSAGNRRLVVSARYPEDEQRIHELWQAEWNEFDFAEPFERIRDAIGEAQKAAA